MPKSKLRGGAKAHKARVTTRNNALKGLRKKAQAEYQEMFEKQMEEMKAQYQNENGEMVDLNNANWSMSLIIEQLYQQKKV